MYSSWRGKLAIAGAVATLVASGPVAAYRWGVSHADLVLAANGGHFVVGAKSIGGLYPGASRTMSINVSNPYRVPIQVRSVSGQVVSTSDRRCRADARNLVVDRYEGSAPAVPARATRTVGAVRVRMPGGAGSACQRVTFHLELRGTATVRP